MLQHTMEDIDTIKSLDDLKISQYAYCRGCGTALLKGAGDCPICANDSYGVAEMKRYISRFFDEDDISQRLDDIKGFDKCAFHSVKLAHWIKAACVSVCASYYDMEHFKQHLPPYVSSVDKQINKM